jgi:hypothetical protein
MQTIDIGPLKLDGSICALPRLATVETCRAVIARYSDDTKPCGNEIGAKLAAVLIGSYPGREIADPATYSRAIVSVLAEQSGEIGKEAVDRITRRLKYLPTRAEIVAAIEEVAGERRALFFRAQAHIQERDRREQMRRDGERRETERRALRETLGDAWDAWWEIPMARRYTGTPEVFAAGWKAASDKAAFCESWGQREESAA